MRYDGGVILTLDLATNTGWACGAPGDADPRFGHVTLPSTGEDIGRFAMAYDQWLCEKLDADQPRMVVFEAPILPQRTTPVTVRKLSGLVWHTEFVCVRRRIMCREGRASSVKKLFTGYGFAKKADTMSIARRYGWRVRTDDEADACALWAYSVCKVAPQHATRFALGPLGARAA